MNRACIYKLKEDKSVDETMEYFSKYVYVDDFAKHSLDKDLKLHAIYRYIDINTMELSCQICNCFMLPYDVFEEHFELYMDAGQINDKLRELEGK